MRPYMNRTYSNRRRITGASLAMVAATIEIQADCNVTRQAHEAWGRDNQASRRLGWPLSTLRGEPRIAHELLQDGRRMDCRAAVLPIVTTGRVCAVPGDGVCGSAAGEVLKVLSHPMCRAVFCTLG